MWLSFILNGILKRVVMFAQTVMELTEFEEACSVVRTKTRCWRQVHNGLPRIPKSDVALGS